jgi:hypothetical protein
MISLPNFTNKMELTQEQYDHLLAVYVEQVVDGMDMDDLVQFVSDKIEEEMRSNYSTPDELIEEVKCCFGDDDYVEDLLKDIKNM